MYNWALYLIYLQSIPLKLNVTIVPTKPTIVCYFKESLKSLIKAGIDQNAHQLDSFGKLVAKTVKAEAKLGL